MSQPTLVYIVSNRKGDDLYRELRKVYPRSIYIDGGYGSLPYPLAAALRILERAGLPVKARPSLDFSLRRIIARRVFGAIRKNVKPGPDTHIVYWHGLFPITRQWAELGKNGTITDVAMDETYFEHFHVPPGRPRRVREEMWETNARNCEFIFTHSNWAQAANAKLYPQEQAKIKRVGWGSDMAPLKPEEVFSQERKNQILCVGHDYFRKGVDVYNQVAGMLRRKFPGLECAVAGRPGKKLDLSSLGNLKVLGPVNRSRLDGLLRESKLFMLFSRFEPAGHVTIEAMSYGVPVICSDRGGIGEPVVHGRTGFVCDIDKPEGIVECASRLLSDEQMLDEFRHEAYRHATGSWQWKHTAERIYRYMTTGQAN